MCFGYFVVLPAFLWFFNWNPEKEQKETTRPRWRVLMHNITRRLQKDERWTIAYYFIFQKYSTLEATRHNRINYLQFFSRCANDHTQFLTIIWISAISFNWNRDTHCFHWLEITVFSCTRLRLFRIEFFNLLTVGILLWKFCRIENGENRWKQHQ